MRLFDGIGVWVIKAYRRMRDIDDMTLNYTGLFIGVTPWWLIARYVFHADLIWALPLLLWQFLGTSMVFLALHRVVKKRKKIREDIEKQF